MYTTFDQVYLAAKGTVDKTTLGDGVIQPEVSKKYIRDLESDDTVFLTKAVETEICNSNVKYLSRLGIDSGFLHAGSSVAKDSSGEYKTANYNTNTNKIVCNPYVGALKYEDEAVDVSLEGEKLGNTLVEEAAQKSREEIERIALYSDTAISDGDFENAKDYNKADGFVKLSANKIYASDLKDQKASTIFEGLLNAVDAKYRKTNSYMIFVDPDLFNKYLDELIVRNTNLGDQVLKDGALSYVLYKGYQVFSTPVCANPLKPEDKVAIAVYKNNATLSFFKEMKVTGTRKELDFATYMAMKINFGFNYKNENVSAVCYLAKENPSKKTQETETNPTEQGSN